MTTRLLLADDEVDIRVLLGVRLRHLDVEIVEAADGAAALEACSGTAPPGVAVLDHRMPERSGLAVARHLRDRSPAVPVAIFSAFVDEELIHACREIDAAVYAKTDLGQLVAWVEQQVAGLPA